MRRLMIILAFVMLALATPVCAEETVLLSENFESRAVMGKWDGGEISDAAVADGKNACAVNNPYGEEVDGRISHILYYLDTLPMKPGEIYRISLDAMAFGADSAGPVSFKPRFGSGVNNIVFDFDSIPDDWTRISGFFMVPNDADYGFLLELRNGDRDLGFMIDNLEIRKIDLSPEGLVLNGPEKLNIPVAGEQSTRYFVEGYTADGERVSLLSEIVSLSAENLPAGVSFDPILGVVTVSEGCPDGASFTITCTPPDYLDWEPVATRISLTKNILYNSDFSQGEDGWIIDGGYEFGYGASGQYISLGTDEPGPFGYSASIAPESPVLLVEGEMYVFRATVRVESGSDSSAYSQNTAISRDGQVDINIIDLSAGGWIEVFAAFTPEASGIYSVNINFTTTDPGFVSVRNMSLAPEFPTETFLTLHAPGNIAIPETETIYPLNAYIRDQSGEVIGSRCRITLYPDDRGVSLTDGGIAVEPDAMPGTYEIYAVSVTDSSLESSLNFTVGYENIADGGFEEYGANYRWAAAAPATLKIDENVDGHFARINSSDDFAVVMNNSYMHLYPGVAYAFRADIVGGKGSVVTAFIEDVNGERLPVVQSETFDGKIFELFQTDEEVIGRLMLYITSADEGDIDLWIDNVEIFRSIVTASMPRVRGLAESGATLTAEFEFYNNMDETNDTSACAISWYGMSGSGGDPVRVGSGREFVVLPELVGRYVYFEVTPICAVTGLSGLPAQSVPMPIGALREDDIAIETAPEPDDQTAEPKLSPVELPDDTDVTLPFEDLKRHWAKKYVLPLYAAGVLSGRSEFEFDPDDNITRAELAAVVCRAFGAEGGEQHFSDIPSDAWYAGAVASLSSLGIVNGTSDGEFSPDVWVNREELATILMRVYEAVGGSCNQASLSVFYDEYDISDWARDSVSRGLKLGIVNGTEQSTFMPKRAATRAEVCAMLCRLVDALNDESLTD